MKLPLMIRKMICFFERTQWKSDTGVEFQKGFYGCGKACIKMILSFYMIEFKQFKDNFIKTGALKLSEVISILEKYNLNVAGYQMSSLHELKSFIEQSPKVQVLLVFKGLYFLSPYAIIDHIVLLESIKKNYVVVKDPFLGNVSLKVQLFNNKWTNKCLIVKPPDTN